MDEALTAQTVTIHGAGGDPVEAYLAQPLDAPLGSAGGVVVIHHMPGWDRATKEITRRFAACGYLAICPNLYFREAPGASPDDAAAAARAGGGVPDDRLVGDVDGAADRLRTLAASNGKVATIGYCSGGRQSVLAACRLQLNAAIDCYGAFVMRQPPATSPGSIQPIAALLDDLTCPLLGLFGADDQFPAADEVAELDRALTSAGKDHQFHLYPGAGHAFFNTDRPSFRAEAAADGWEQIWAFLHAHLDSRPLPRH